MKMIPWKNAKIMIQSKYVDAALQTITSLDDKGYSVIKFSDFKKKYTDISSLTVSARHLTFLLKDLGNQGIVDYHPEVSDLIIINDKEFNQLRTNIPIFVETKNGIVSLKEIIDKFGSQQYVLILDLIYQSYKIAIKNHDLRIFPEKLKTSELEAVYKYRMCENDYGQTEEHGKNCLLKKNNRIIIDYNKSR